MKIPVDFSKKAEAKKEASGYPTQISAQDLMSNFYYCALDAVNSVNSQPQPFSTSEKSYGTYKTRLLQLNPPPPNDGKTYIFGFKGGNFTWIATEAC